MMNRDRALQALQREVDELRRRICLLEQGGAPAAAPAMEPAAAPAPAMEPAAAAAPAMEPAAAPAPAMEPAAAPAPAMEPAAEAPAQPATAAQPAPAPVAETGFGDFVAARTGNRAKTYHIRACYYAQSFQASAGGCLFYPTQEAAAAAGFKPCRRCAAAAVPAGYVATDKAKGSKTYHRRSCRYSAPFLNSGRPYREFADRAAAETAGHRPCERCVDRPGYPSDPGIDP